MNTALVIGAMCFLLLVDDFSRKMWVFFTKEKSDLFNEFQKFKSLVENESRCPIITLRFDNRGEFCSNEVTNICSEHNIKRQFITLYTCKRNGVVEGRR
jgi:transposase InsO family protein